ncbi:hypothetical protein [Ruegeria arenilitoris]|uniref:Uncharacterized protein n=1 Tax=Ruegeria arenilitoris TaxID=1173585 RepID=A0A238K298_9RHOB|nr:hypothetical protein [Ruegeria arenilitoris]SMX36494.1 hypothetical protein RUA8715_01418 [Ruegeria arenilitoris]
MLDVLLGSLSALEDLMKAAKKDKDPSIVRLAVSEAETASKTCVRLSQAISAYAAEHPEEMSRNNRPTPDPETDSLRDRFMAILRDVGAIMCESTVDRHVRALEGGEWSEGDYRRKRGHVLAPNNDTLSLPDWYEILRRHRGLNRAEEADYRALNKEHQNNE